MAETASREADLLNKIVNLESELKVANQELTRTKSELDRLSSLHSDTSQTAESLDSQKRQLREELKDFKLREQRLLNDYSELEEENISLQKTVIFLKYFFLTHELQF